MKSFVIFIILFSTNTFARDYEVKPGDRVYTQYGTEAKVYATKNDSKKILIIFENEEIPRIWNIDDLAIENACTSDSYCTGDRVINTLMDKGNIVAIFQKDDTVFVKYDTQPQLRRWSTDKLFKIN